MGLLVLEALQKCSDVTSTASEQGSVPDNTSACRECQPPSSGCESVKRQELGKRCSLDDSDDDEETTQQQW
jgi:hypothetical protein